MVQSHVSRWQEISRSNRRAAKHLFTESEWRPCISRAYYAAYQLATDCCIAHGDQALFPPGWNNPSHQQLPDLILNNGELPQSSRRTLAHLLRALRTAREDSDYRPGRTVDESGARAAILAMEKIYQLFGEDYHETK